MIKKAYEKFKSLFGDSNDLKGLRSPGRVNLIGEHTDYNDGFVLPAAISREIKAVFRKRKDDKVKIFSIDFNELKEFSLAKELEKEGSWIDYSKGVASQLKKEISIKFGFEAVFISDLPRASGLSSSAAFELANAFILSHVNEIEIERKRLALISQKAENEFIGVKCGIMDQFAIALGEKDHSIFIDTRSLNYKKVPLNLKDHIFIIANTNKKRELSTSEYNRRREECEKAVEIIRKKVKDIKALRDVLPEELSTVEKAIDDQTIFKRVKHVILENKRVLESVSLLEKGELKGFGKLMITSHESLQKLYEVSSFELDVLVKEALKISGVLGSRMTGAGFGGCTVSLLKKESKDEFIEKVSKEYEKKTGLTADFYVVEPVSGTEIFDLEEKL